MRPNKVETAVQWFRNSSTLLPGFSGHGDSIYDIKFLYIKTMYAYSLVRGWNRVTVSLSDDDNYILLAP